VKKLRPFFPYFGSKWELAPKYPKPLHKEIIEPFAGSAGYSLHYPDKKVALWDIDESVCAVWQYLIDSSGSEIASLPAEVNNVDELNVCPEAKLLIGFWLAKGHPYPVKKPCSWMLTGKYPNQFWGEHIKARIVEQQQYIRHWECYYGSWHNVPRRSATYFIDPPYIDQCGRRYRHNKIDYFELRYWINALNSQVIVCENNGAFWLPFRHLTDAISLSKKKRSEVIYYSEGVF
jgi:D12 class N6 adenine-specific DNA methyltransferase